MDALESYHLSTSLYLVLESVPLLLTPRLLLSLLTPTLRDPTALETYLCRTLALALLALATLSFLLSGMLPLSTLVSESENEHTGGTSPYAMPSVFVLTVYHVAGMVYCYVQVNGSGDGGGDGGGGAAFGLGVALKGALAAWGVWCLVFGGGGGDGARGKVSGWPFRNREETERKREKMRRRKGL